MGLKVGAAELYPLFLVPFTQHLAPIDWLPRKGVTASCDNAPHGADTDWPLTLLVNALGYLCSGLVPLGRAFDAAPV
jgi:hypothetical protein